MIKYSILRRLTLLVIFFTFACLSEAQEKKFGIGLNAGIFTGNETTVDFGLDAQFEAPIKGLLSASADLGVIAFVHQPETVFFLPFLVGMKLRFGESGFYFHGQFGYTAFFAFSTNQIGGNSKLAYAPGIGYHVSKHLDASFRYFGFNGSSMHSINLRLAYIF